MRNDHGIKNCYRGGGIALRGKGIALRGGGIAKRGMGAALKKGGDVAQDKKLIKKAFKMHDMQEHKGEHTKLDKLKKGGRAHYADGSSDTPEERGRKITPDELKSLQKQEAEDLKNYPQVSKEDSSIFNKFGQRAVDMFGDNKRMNAKKGGMAKKESKMHEAKESKKKEMMEESKMKKGGRAMKASGGGLKPVGDLRIPRKIRSSLDYMKKGGRAKKKYGGKC